MKKLSIICLASALFLSACDEYESTVCDINYQGNFVNSDGSGAGATFTDPTSRFTQSALSKVPAHESDVGKAAAKKKVDQVNQAANTQELIKAEKQWQLDFAQWQKEHGDQFGSYANKRKQSIESPGLIDGGLDENAPPADASTFATNFSYPPPQRPVRTTAALDKCRQLSVNEAFNGNFLRGVDRLFAGEAKEQSSIMDMFIHTAFAMAAKGDAFDVSPTQLAVLSKLDPRYGKQLAALKSVHARRAKEYGDRVWQLAFEKKNGLKLSFFVDEDPARACELLNKTVERKSGSSSWALTDAKTHKGVKIKHPFDGAACSTEKLAGYRYVNFDDARRASAPAITLLISKTDERLDFFIPNYDLESGRESQLQASFRAFFGR